MSNELIGIDLGHGINTFPPSKGVYVDKIGYAEHTANAKVGVILDKLLKNNGFRTTFAQQPNQLDVPLKNRTDHYKRHNVDAIVSIHFNWSRYKTADGVGAFYWYQDAKAKRMVEIYADEAKKAGVALWGDGVFASIPGTWSEFHMNREPYKAGIPSILSENGFMSNPEDFQRIFKDPAYLEEIAEVLAKTVCRYFGVTYKSGEAAAAKPIQHIDDGEFLIRVKVDNLHTYTKADWDAKKGAPIVNENDVFTVKRTVMVEGYKMYQLVSGWYITASDKYVEVLQQPKPVIKKTKYIRVKVPSLYTYNTKNWNDKGEIVHENDVFTVIEDKFPIDGGYMYRIKSGLYITANPNYVDVFEK